MLSLGEFFQDFPLSASWGLGFPPQREWRGVVSFNSPLLSTPPLPNSLNFNPPLSEPLPLPPLFPPPVYFQPLSNSLLNVANTSSPSYNELSCIGWTW